MLKICDICGKYGKTVILKSFANKQFYIPPKDQLAHLKCSMRKLFPIVYYLLLESHELRCNQPRPHICVLRYRQVRIYRQTLVVTYSSERSVH